MKPIRILLADDHTLVRAGIRSLLEQVPNVEVVAEANDGRDALRLIREHQPDIVFMDVTMQGLNGLDATAQITKTCPGVQVIMLSMHRNEEYVSQALQVGAAGYLLKDAATTELELAVQAVARGETYLSPAVSKHVVDRYLQRVNNVVEDMSEPAPNPLTVRQREILQLIAKAIPPSRLPTCCISAPRPSKPIAASLWTGSAFAILPAWSAMRCGPVCRARPLALFAFRGIPTAFQGFPGYHSSLWFIYLRLFGRTRRTSYCEEKRFVLSCCTSLSLAPC